MEDGGHASHYLPASHPSTPVPFERVPRIIYSEANDDPTPGQPPVITQDRPSDFRGLSLAVGQTIVYPGRASSSLWMNAGIILEIKSTKDYRGRENWTLKVQRTHGRSWNKPEDLIKPVSITNLSNVVIIGEE